MSVTTVSIVLAAASVVAASVSYSFQIWNQTRLGRTDLLRRLYATWDTLEFQQAFHRLYWRDYHEYDSFLEHVEGKRHIGGQAPRKRSTSPSVGGEAPAREH